MGDGNLLDLVAKVILHDLAEVFEGSLVGLGLGLLLFGLLDFDAVLGNADELVAFELLELGDGVLID